MAHRLNPVALREYDIRGVVGTDLDAADVEAAARSFGTMVRRDGGSRVMLGRDGRLTSPELAAAATRGLLASGCDVTDIGLAPSPMLYFSVFDTGADAGLMITASHNPPEWNGIKLILRHRPFYGADIAELGAISAAGNWESDAGRLSHAPMIDRYVARLAGDYQGGAFTIAWDCSNGAAGPVVERLIRLLPGTHHLVHSEVDGRFPNHEPDPTIEANLADLKRVVIDRGCDFGVAFDGDADRIGAVDGQGRMLGGDELLAILAEPVLKAQPGAAIIADVKASQALFDRIAALGGRPDMWKSGHSLVKARLQALDAPLAGEMGGHIIFGHRWYGVDDGILAALRLMEAVSAAGTSLTALKSAMPVMVNTPELRIPCPENRKFAVVAEVLARLRATNARINETDGARVMRDDGWWLLRASNTQAAVTARVEARDAAALARMQAELAEQLRLSGVDWG
ncbi:phosphomannomutase [Sandarakinorhabdus cyanobacteriorum]|uniref:Phosphomannomutase n=1 Tax=Sandarakinorhabdus cyanobacteriorum TaxID=1981098 RepID=A0A255YHS3_9SPHN|nr:phosphomannomutase/phosphoglucomutase [Sandarakinorhabdus cyanobacteriorum]OYQ28741.1 phosphomannomutase [Sandarakinorhabdus cyanobacteriorum]